MKRKLVFNTLILILLIITLIFVFSVKCKKNDVFVIEPFKVMKSGIGGLPTIDDRVSYFLVTGFKPTEIYFQKLDSVLCSVINPDTIKFNEFVYDDFRRIYFYKKTKITNNEYLEKFPNQFYRITVVDDEICAYSFEKYGPRLKSIQIDGKSTEVTNVFSCN